MLFRLTVLEPYLSMSSDSRLPQDIIDSIIDELLLCSRRDLLSCTSVSRSFAQRSRYHIFLQRNVFIADQPDDESKMDRTVDFLQYSETTRNSGWLVPVVDLVQELHIGAYISFETPRIHMSSFLKILALLPYLRVIELFGLRGDGNLTPFIPAFNTYLTGVHTLRIRTTTFAFPHILHFLPNLRRLEADNLLECLSLYDAQLQSRREDGAENELLSPTASLFPVALNLTHAKVDTTGASCILNLLSRTPSITSLRWLSVRCANLHDVRAVADILALCSNITSLELSVDQGPDIGALFDIYDMIHS